MKVKRMDINGIPAIVWGDESNRVFLYVHGKMCSKETAQTFAQIAEEKGYQTISFDLPQHGERKDCNERCDIWTGKKDLKKMEDYTFSKWNEVSLYACSLGAFFSLHTYADCKFVQCLFQSPMIDMEYMIHQMMIWYDVTEERLKEEKEIETSFDTLRWDYFQYVLQHPIKEWKNPTCILFGGKDNFQTLDIMQRFSKENHCKLTISENSEHPFMQEQDKSIVESWLRENIKS